MILDDKDGTAISTGAGYCDELISTSFGEQLMFKPCVMFSN
jgi:hypothetical protein